MKLSNATLELLAGLEDYGIEKNHNFTQQNLWHRSDSTRHLQIYNYSTATKKKKKKKKPEIYESHNQNTFKNHHDVSQKQNQTRNSRGSVWREKVQQMQFTPFELWLNQLWFKEPKKTSSGSKNQRRPALVQRTKEDTSSKYIVNIFTHTTDLNRYKKIQEPEIHYLLYIFYGFLKSCCNSMFAITFWCQVCFFFRRISKSKRRRVQRTPPEIRRWQCINSRK